jgi:hypothetical protein
MNLATFREDIPTCFPSIQTFRLLSKASEFAVIDLLSALPKVRTFQSQTTRDWDLGKLKDFGHPIFSELVRRRQTFEGKKECAGTEAHEEILLPELRTLYFGGPAAWVPLPSPATTNSIERLLNFRLMQKRPLDKVVVFIAPSHSSSTTKQEFYVQEEIFTTSSISSII